MVRPAGCARGKAILTQNLIDRSSFTCATAAFGVTSDYNPGGFYGSLGLVPAWQAWQDRGRG
jgi:hypothetical protein